MSHMSIAKRINEAITQNGGYNKISEKTGISVSTLVRAAKGKTEPKLTDVMRICSATGVSLNRIAYGQDEGSATEKYTAEIVKGLATINEALLRERLSELEKRVEEISKNS
ncbi:helix-turn-helix domain-containing protein [Vibrio fluvialis]|nr:helix-turn-helix domain-containing protein [Vibrio fluvialis]MBY7839643.1 helix-turn-helix domain-containing protein [Vibrio fluvialis]